MRSVAARDVAEDSADRRLQLARPRGAGDKDMVETRAGARPAAKEPPMNTPLDRATALRTLDGRDVTLGDVLGRATLVVNVASRCGYTPQYEGLEALHRDLGPRGLAVLGFPCDQFGHQEPGDEAEIATFCRLNFGVSFPMFAKIEVNGAGTHPLFRQLKPAAPGLLGTQAVKWNFTKFLIDRDGRVLRRFAPADEPATLRGEIEALLS
jgi:glutathione peroxidase